MKSILQTGKSRLFFNYLQLLGRLQFKLSGARLLWPVSRPFAAAFLGENLCLLLADN